MILLLSILTQRDCLAVTPISDSGQIVDFWYQFVSINPIKPEVTSVAGPYSAEFLQFLLHASLGNFGINASDTASNFFFFIIILSKLLSQVIRYWHLAQQLWPMSSFIITHPALMHNNPFASMTDQSRLALQTCYTQTGADTEQIATDSSVFCLLFFKIKAMTYLLSCQVWSILTFHVWLFKQL